MVVGETVSFGRYEQDKYLPNTWEPINWRVLAVEDGKALLLAERVLDCRPYNTEDTAATWQSCSLRAWLNKEFYSTAFDASEQAAIVTARIRNEDKTDDTVFLLSYKDITNPAFGFSADCKKTDPVRRAQPTKHAKSRGVWMKVLGAYCGKSYWWLRTPGSTPHHASVVSHAGDVSSYSVTHTTVGVRPALWIRL